MNVLQWFQVITVIVSALAAILAWVAKIRWSREYTKAKDATIVSKDAQIEVLKTELENLRRLNPEELQKWYIGLKKLADERIKSLEEQIKQTKIDYEKIQQQGNILLEQGGNLLMEQGNLQPSVADHVKEVAEFLSAGLDRHIKSIEEDLSSTRAAVKEYSVVEPPSANK